MLVGLRGAVLLAVVIGCSDPKTSAMLAPPDESPATFVDVQIALHASGCSEGGCHSPPDGKGELELVDSPWENLVGRSVTTCAPELGKSRVVAGQPAASYLLNKLQGVDLCSGARMPLGCDGTDSRPCMKPERITLIERWIAAGAPRD